jgi:hypothetical protein
LPEAESVSTKFEVRDSSPAMRGQEPPPRQRNASELIPFDALHCGQSVAVPFVAYSEIALRALIGRKNRELAPKRFDLIRWPESQLFEIGRVE